MNSGADVAENISSALALCEKAAKNGAEFILLPEVFNDRGKNATAETIPGPSLKPFLDLAKKKKIFILSGSLRESIPKNKKFHNSSALIDDTGKIIAVYRKIHLFDVELGDKIIRESAKLAPGRKPRLTSVKKIKTGLSICYDVRFPELYRHYSSRGAQILCVPSSFTQATGRPHWEILLRARAIENQCFVLAPNQTGVDGNGVPSHGHSLIIDPWGNILAEGSADRTEIVSATLDFEKLDQLRKHFPALTHRKLK
jgi:predicted amidohydrolase